MKVPEFYLTQRLCPVHNKTEWKNITYIVSPVDETNQTCKLYVVYNLLF